MPCPSHERSSQFPSRRRPGLWLWRFGRTKLIPQRGKRVVGIRSRDEQAAITSLIDGVDDLLLRGRVAAETVHDQRRLALVPLWRGGHGFGRISRVCVFKDVDVVGKGIEARVDLHARVRYDGVGPGGEGGAHGRGGLLHVRQGVCVCGAGAFVDEDAVDVDVGRGVGGPVTVVGNVGYEGADVAVRPRGVHVAEGGDGRVGVQLRDVRDVVRVRVGVSARAAVGADYHGEVCGWVGGDGGEEGGPGAGQGVVA